MLPWPQFLSSILATLSLANQPTDHFTLGWGSPASVSSLPPRAHLAAHRPTFVAFRHNYRKKYDNSSHEELHARIFEEAEQIVERHNARFKLGRETFTMAINAFADLTEEQMRARLGTRMPSSKTGSSNGTRPIDTSISIPDRVDWREFLGPVKDQGQCGSCYAFASVAPIEAALNKKGVHVRLSEQEIVDCSANNGCDGGWMATVYDYVHQRGGLAQEQDYPYRAHKQQCAVNGERAGGIKGYGTTSNQDELTNGLATRGPMAVAVQAGIRSFGLYHGGIYNDRECGSGPIDHGVAAVGYGNDPSPYYIIRNSWGSGWGEGGHMRMARDICHVSEFGFFIDLD